MIEIIYKNNNMQAVENATLKLPKNIRQIGHGDSDYQIYIEDYLMSYLKKRPEREGDIRYGVLLGDVKVGNGYTYFFINGAVDVEEVMENTIIFNDDVWTGLYEDINSYFIGNRIVGWFAALNANANNDMMNIKKLHLDNFAGVDKLFLKLDMDEDEESFYVYENTGLTKQPCYHIYFNKSEYMEDYIFGTGKKDRYKKPEVKMPEGGKYGILLNNINEKRTKEAMMNEKTEENKDDGKVVLMDDLVTKLGKRTSFGKIATFAALVTIAASVGVLHRDGKLKEVSDNIVNFASGIINSDDEKDIGQIISVNGVVETGTTKNNSNGQTEGTDGETVFNIEETQNGETQVNTGVQESESSDSEKIGESEDMASVAQAGSETGATESSPVDETTSIIEDNSEESTESMVDASNIYVVKEGDTLLSICIDVYNDKSKIDEVIEANNITNPDIVIPGEELIMP